MFERYEDGCINDLALEMPHIVRIALAALTEGPSEVVRLRERIKELEEEVARLKARD